MLRIALPNKGRLADDARELLADAGLDIRSRGDRALTASLGGEFEAVFLRAQDIPEFLADGVADAGITGLDLVVESGRELSPLLDLGFGRCRIVLAARDDSAFTSLEAITGSPRVATTFPRVARSFFASENKDVEIIPISGAAEIAPHLGIADMIVDITSTGSTLRMNGMKELTTILQSSAHFIVAPDVAAERGTPRARVIAELVTALQSVLSARGKRYLMANVPKAALERVRTIIPGLNGPTVIDILDGGTQVAVHAVVDASSIYRTIADLKELGAQGILVTRIERLMP